ncbi:helix-turn-helix transcriptional regulator [Lysinibacillus sp. FSL K6-0075]|uniref:helix-turn-helix domain-containing protein n=1 Tax=Lysinibacillus sp. FSL K6-0075 TaxID=2921415 RepID=UPI00315847BC
MFAQNLTKLRKERKISQYKLAELIGFSRGRIANYEQGSREPDFETLDIFADFFNVSSDWLLGRTNERNFLLEDDL